MVQTCAAPRLRQSLAALGSGYGLNEEQRTKNIKQKTARTDATVRAAEQTTDQRSECDDKAERGAALLVFLTLAKLLNCFFQLLARCVHLLADLALRSLKFFAEFGLSFFHFLAGLFQLFAS